MSYGEEQRKEIETIKKRQIKLELSDADCDRLARKCGEYGLTIGELIENFVGDLVDGTYSNGSDERMYAQQWFERCWFGMFPEPSLLNHLLSEGHEPQHFLDALNNIETAKRDIKQSQKDIAEPTDESLKNMWFYMQTKELPCEMEERNVSQHRIFSMDTKCINEPKKKRTTRRKK